MRQALLRWYRRAHRRLPWRAAPGTRADPYAVLVSEAMLQQTQVATVVDYFERFMEAFPTVQALAASDEQDVLRLWQGLGYYRRARNLRRAARHIVDEHDGRIPSDPQQLRALPGVGPYTAGAIASIAFGQHVPVLDGNVARVLVRLFAVAGPIDRPDVRAAMWELAARLVRRARHPGDVNQALMELGATVCTPRRPACRACPVSRACAALAQGRVDQLPTSKPRAAQREVRHDVFALRRRGQVLIEQRGNDGLWAGLWQLPTIEDAESKGAAARAIAERLDLQIEPPVEVGCFTHITTHRRIDFHVHEAGVTNGRRRRGTGVWRSLEDVDDLPMSNAQRRAIEQLRAHRQGAGERRQRRGRG